MLFKMCTPQGSLFSTNPLQPFIPDTFVNCGLTTQIIIDCKGLNLLILGSHQNILLNQIDKSINEFSYFPMYMYKNLCIRFVVIVSNFYGGRPHLFTQHCFALWLAVKMQVQPLENPFITRSGSNLKSLAMSMYFM